jgi:hypothetical protein
MLPIKEMDDHLQINLARPLETAQQESTQPLHLKPVMKTLSCHSARDYLAHFLGRTAGLGVFVGLAHSGWSPVGLKIVAGGAGAVAAGTVAFLIGKNQIGTDSVAKRAAVSLCTLTIAAAGASVAAVGSIQPVAALAAGAAATTAVSLIGYCLFNRPEQNASKTVAFTIATAASLTTVAMFTPNWVCANTTFASRSIGTIVEASLIEICKSHLEQLGPSVNRNALMFEGKAYAALLGFLPYLTAAVVTNGILSGKLQPANDSVEFMDLWTPLLVGALANAVKAAANAAAVMHVHTAGKFVKNREDKVIRPCIGLTTPDPDKVGQKIAARIFLNTCRNAVYFYLREKGLNIIEAGCLAQGCYTIFAQNRDLMFDLMQGEGWKEQEPVLSVRALPEPVTGAIDEAESIVVSADD